MSQTFRALVLDQVGGGTTAAVQALSEKRLPAGDVRVDIAYSTLNYKDALAITGSGRIVRDFPFVPGIDFAGTVRSSDSPAWRAGDPVLLTGWGVGEKHWGGLAEQARVAPEWLVPLPAGLSLRHAMALGTAGFTAMLAVMALEEQGAKPADGPVVVTGAGGGVGGIAIRLLARRGWHVAALTGRPELGGYLKDLGAAEIVDRGTASEVGDAPLGKQRWAAAIDSVGGATLKGLLQTLRYHGVAVACGLAGGATLEGTVFPFILRGVRLVGIDSVYAAEGLRRRAWDQLAAEIEPARLDAMTRVISLDEVPAVAAELLRGSVRGRTVVDLGAG